MKCHKLTMSIIVCKFYSSIMQIGQLFYIFLSSLATGSNFLIFAHDDELGQQYLWNHFIIESPSQFGNKRHFLELELIILFRCLGLSFLLGKNGRSYNVLKFLLNVWFMHFDFLKKKLVNLFNNWVVALLLWLYIR
jgi:hypothetical protein